MAGKDEAITPIPKRSNEYARIAKLSPKAIERLGLLLDSRNEMVRMGAINTILNKVLPNLKSVEVGGEIGDDGKRQPIQLLVNAGSGFIPATVKLLTSSTEGFATGSPSIQNPDMAQAGKEDNNINIRSDKAGAS